MSSLEIEPKMHKQDMNLDSNMKFIDDLWATE